MREITLRAMRHRSRDTQLKYVKNESMVANIVGTESGSQVTLCTCLGIRH